MNYDCFTKSLSKVFSSSSPSLSVSWVSYEVFGREQSSRVWKEWEKGLFKIKEKERKKKVY